MGRLPQRLPHGRRIPARDIGGLTDQFKQGALEAQDGKQPEGEFLIAANGAEDKREAQSPDRQGDAAGGEGNVMDQVKFLPLMQVTRHRERIPGKNLVLAPVLQAGAQPVGMPRPAIARLDKVERGGNQTFLRRSRQIGQVALAGEHPQFVIVGQRPDRRPAKVILRAQIRVAGDGRDQDFHCPALVTRIPGRTQALAEMKA